jgi:hypothetical protein
MWRKVGLFFFFSFFANGCDLELVSSPSSRLIVSGTDFSPHSSIEEDIPTLLIHQDDLRHWQIIPSVAPYHSDYFVYCFGVSSLFPTSQSPISFLGTKSATEDPIKMTQDIFTSPFTKATPYFSITGPSDISLGTELTRPAYDQNVILFQRQETDPPSRLSDRQAQRSCLSTISIGLSSIPKAGKGVFVKRSVKKGETITVAPVFVLPRHEVIQTIPRSLLMNYCLISAPQGEGEGEGSESDVALLPATQMAMVNHGGLSQANVMMAWTEATTSEGLLSWTPKALEDEYRPPLELAYIATRDLSAGEELLIDYGEAWEGRWREYLSDLERWVQQSDEGREILNKPQFRSFVTAPEGLFPAHWMGHCLGSTPCMSQEELKARQADYQKDIERAISLLGADKEQQHVSFDSN